jgi:hypothetical protein
MDAKLVDPEAKILPLIKYGFSLKLPKQGGVRWL